MHYAATQRQRQRQRPPVLVLRYCPRPPRRHLAARNTKGTGARPQPRTTPPPRSAPAPCPARPALLLSFAPSPPRASDRALPCDAPVPCQCPALRRCGHARPAVTCNSAKQRARQSPRPTPRHRHATTPVLFSKFQMNKLINEIQLENGALAIFSLAPLRVSVGGVLLGSLKLIN